MARHSRSYWLSREEWQATYALFTLLQQTGDFPMEDDFGRLQHKAIMHLAKELGYKFLQLHVMDDGRMYARCEDPPYTGNQAFLAQLQLGMQPNYLLAFEALQRLLEDEEGQWGYRPDGWSGKSEVQRLKELTREALERIREDVSAAKDDVPTKEWRERLREALEVTKKEVLN